MRFFGIRRRELRTMQLFLRLSRDPVVTRVDRRPITGFGARNGAGMKRISTDSLWNKSKESARRRNGRGLTWK